jgi:drug/metabolite transporter (DMT)-like permease
MGVILALFAAASYGTGDFFGGLASKRAPLAMVVWASGLVGLLTALLAVPLLSPGSPPPHDLALGAGAGIVGGAAIACLYRGLAIGRMSVVAPITAVVAAVVPVVFGVLLGERPTPLALAGIACALAAVAAISRSADEDVTGMPEPRRSGIVEAFGAGAGFGVLYILLAQTSHGMWPLVASRCVSVACAAAVALVSRRMAAPPRAIVPTIAACGFFDTSGNALYLLALRHTLIAIAAVLTSLYPATTVVLARIVLRERLARIQWAGVLLAAVGVALIAAGS